MNAAKRKRDDSPDEDTQISKKPKKLPKILDGVYFKVNDWDGESINLTAQCQLCPSQVRGQVTSTGNFFKHFK